MIGVKKVYICLISIWPNFAELNSIVSFGSTKLRGLSIRFTSVVNPQSKFTFGTYSPSQCSAPSTLQRDIFAKREERTGPERSRRVLKLNFNSVDIVARTIWQAEDLATWFLRLYSYPNPFPNVCRSVGPYALLWLLLQYKMNLNIHFSKKIQKMNKKSKNFCENVSTLILTNIIPNAY